MKKYICLATNRCNFVILHLEMDAHYDNGVINYYNPVRGTPRRIQKVWIPSSLETNRVFDTLIEAETYARAEEPSIKQKAIDAIDKQIEYKQKARDKIANLKSKIRFINTIK